MTTDNSNDWHWQMRHRICDRPGLEARFELTEDERRALAFEGDALPLGLTPYYASLIDPNDPDDPIRKTMIPRFAEHQVSPGERRDPLGEEAHEPVPGLIHTYPGKVLLLVVDQCATYCRFCTRSRLVGRSFLDPLRARLEPALAYIRAHPEIRDVLLSGGDPLLLPDARLDELLGALRDIPHVELVRIGSKLPAVLPQRITPELAAVLAKHHPLWMSLHFTHPRELTPECQTACARLADAGIPLCAQTVLLAGVNDGDGVLAELFQGLLRFRVKPYYLHQCDPVFGSGQFRVPIARGLEIMASLHGHLTGYAVPHYMIDAPGGGGKIPIHPDFVVRREGDQLILRNFRGEEYAYVDPVTDS